MYGLRRFGIKLGLGTIRHILQGLGNPQDRFRSVHIAGTNGKGSIASTLAAILTAAGYRVGLFTSPHLVRFNERIRIAEQPISDDDVLRAHRAIQSLHWGPREPTFFEYSTAMALHEFGRAQVDWAIIEAGMGGRLDATNAITPELSVISNISLEHRAYLGNTIAQIASEKAGIIKPAVPVVTGVKQPAAIAAVEAQALRRKAPLYRLGRHFRVRRDRSQRFTYFGLDDIWRGLRPSLPGDHQIDNTALVLAVCELLNARGLNISMDTIRRGLDRTQWPGRLEIVSRDPFVLLDGAHNLVAAKALARYLARALEGRNITLVAGILDDKPYSAMLQCLLPLCRRAIVTRPRIDRALTPETLYAEARKWVPEVQLTQDVDSAVRLALDTALEGEAICIAGSLYVVGEAKEAIARGIPGLARS